MPKSVTSPLFWIRKTWVKGPASHLRGRPLSRPVVASNIEKDVRTDLGKRQIKIRKKKKNLWTYRLFEKSDDLGLTMEMIGLPCQTMKKVHQCVLDKDGPFQSFSFRAQSNLVICNILLWASSNRAVIKMVPPERTLAGRFRYSIGTCLQ